MSASVCKHSRALPPETCLLCLIPVPPTLYSLALNYLCDNFELCCCQSDLTLKPNVFLPPEICYKIFMKLYNNPLKPPAKGLIDIFQDKNRVTLKKLTLRNSGLVDKELRVLLEHNLQEIELIRCYKLTWETFQLIKGFGTNLSSISIRDYSGLYITPIFKKRKYNKIELPTDQIDQLKLQDCELLVDLTKCQSLIYLELSNCQPKENYNGLGNLMYLETLILNDFNSDIDTVIPTIAKMKTLTTLDISLTKKKFYTRNGGDQKLLPQLIQMKNVKYLEVGGRDVFTGATLPIDANWNYLGVYKNGDFCQNPNIPALIVGGHANEEQLLVSAINFIQRPLILDNILMDLSDFYKSDDCQYPGQALKICLDAINFNSYYICTVYRSMDLLQSIFKKIILDTNHKYLIRHLLSTILTVVNYCRDCNYLLQTCCNLLLKFNIPENTLFEYEKFVEILLQLLRTRGIDYLSQIKCVQLLNAFASNTDTNYKIKLGQLGVITIMCRRIRQRDMCDQDLYLSWSTIRNLTNETPFNCQEFLKYNGLELFYTCYRPYHRDDMLLKASMMGLLGNIAEVQELRPQLLTCRLIEILIGTLINQNNFEENYEAARTIAYLASDGAEAWTDLELPLRDEILNIMVLAVYKWDLKSQSGMNYNSLGPLYRLIKLKHTPQCRYWGAWALANLVLVSPDKYCEIIIKDGNLEIVQELLGHPQEEERVKKLAQIIINSCQK